MIFKKLLLSLAALLLLSCSGEQEIKIDLQSFIPENPVFILQTRDLGSFLNIANRASLLQDNPQLLKKDFREQLQKLSGFFKGSTLVCFSKDSLIHYNYTFLGKGSPEDIQIDSLKNKSVQTFKYDSFSIQEYTLENVKFFISYDKEVLIASNSRAQLEKLLLKEERNKNDILNKVLSAGDPAKTSIIINHQLLDRNIVKSFPDILLPVKNLGSWSVIDIDLEGEKILLNGISTWAEDNPGVLSNFEGNTSQPNLLASVTPANAVGFYSFTYSDFRKLNASFRERDSTRQIISENHVLNFTSEAGLIFTAEEPVLALTITDPALTKEAVAIESEFIEDHRTFSINRLTGDPEIVVNLYPLVKRTNPVYFVNLDNFILFSGNPATLKNIINQYLNKNTLSEKKSYQNAMTHLAGSSSFLMVANSAEFQNKLVEIASPEILSEVKKLNLQNYPILALQFVAETDFAHLHGVLSTTAAAAFSGPQQSGSIELDNLQIVSKPFLLKNDDTKETEVAFQDENNLLYLYSSMGKLLWKKQLEARILGEIYQVDLFKNGNLQLAFSTQNSLTILDRNGNAVKPFPLNFKDAVTQPLSVFDYDNNRNYRFVITQDREILMYDSKGNIVKGFGFGKAASEISQAPQHIRMGNKDYIVFPEKDGKLNILSRQGNQRVRVNAELNFSENGWYEHNSNFVSVNSEGELLKIDERGKITREKTGFEVTPFLTATENVLVLQSENNLRINGTMVTLDFGLYTRPKIFEIDGKSFITITDTQAQKVYIFNEDATLVPGFPVYGTSPADIFQTEEGSFVLGVIGEENSAILYNFK